MLNSTVLSWKKVSWFVLMVKEKMNIFLFFKIYNYYKCWFYSSANSKVSCDEYTFYEICDLTAPFLTAKKLLA